MRALTRTGRLGLFLTATMAILALTACRSGELYTLEVVNKTGYEGMFLYASPNSTDDWGRDHLGNEFLPDGETWTLRVRGRTPMFDVQLVDVDGDTYTHWNIDISSGRLVIDADDLD